MKWALNHMTTPGLGYEAFVDLAARLGCVGIEVRNIFAADAIGPACRPVETAEYVHQGRLAGA